MIIIITKDAAVRQYYQAAPAIQGWGQVHLIGTNRSDAQARADLIALVKQLPVGESLCLIAHGNDKEIGGTGDHGDTWTWTVADMVALLHTETVNVPPKVLFAACSDEQTNYDNEAQDDHGLTNYASAVAASLRATPAAVAKLNGVWLYSYNGGISGGKSLPTVAALGKAVDITGHRVP